MRTSDRVIGTNWWNPPQIIPLVEIMTGKNTTGETLERTRRILTEIGKKPITILKPIPGFVGNRLQIALLREALSLLERGVASIEDIDTAVCFGPGFRYPILGPFRVCDFGGLDVFYHLSEELFKDLDNSSTPPAKLKRLVESGRMGVKSGGGFYDYRNLQDDIVKDRDRKLLAISRAIHGGK
jgi:3-hydroxybutyryl-CoA dehydrogenase